MKLNNFFNFKWILILFFFIPILVNGQIVITEIMYDFPGTEGSGEHDWIEITNNGSDSVDLSVFKFFEANTNHGLKLERGNVNLSSGASAVIANATSTFLSDFPNFNGTLFDSSFSLNSTSAGELIAIRNSELINEDSLTYSSDWGAKDDGNSLQKKSDGKWIPLAPTPGFSDILASSNNGPDNFINQTHSTSSSVTQTSNYTKPDLRPEIFANAGNDKTIIVGADTFFDGKAFGIENKPLENAIFLWNFGDGVIKKGQKVLHSYNYPGRYVVFLDVASGEFSTTDRISVIALPADIIISNVGSDLNKNFIELYNRTNRELDLSWWRLQVDNNFFTLPKNTIILSNEKIIFSKNVTNLNVINDSKINLLYPNGSLAVSFNKTGVGVINIVDSSSQKSNSAGLISEANYDINGKSFIIEKATENEEIAKREDNSASVINSEIIENTAQNNSIWKWITAISSIILLSAGGYIFVKKAPIKKEIDEAQKIAEEIEISE